jgi:Pyrimidine dimer DNA glycosylase
MRMWMVDPEVLCRRHLLGEHVELHMAAAWIAKDRSVAGWAESNCLEPLSIGRRHAELAEEMGRRGYRHATGATAGGVRTNTLAPWSTAPPR